MARMISMRPPPMGVVRLPIAGVGRLIARCADATANQGMVMRRTQIPVASVAPLVGGMSLVHPMGIATATVTVTIAISIVSVSHIAISIVSASASRTALPHMVGVACRQPDLLMERVSAAIGAAWVGAVAPMVVGRDVSHAASAAIAQSTPTFLAVRRAKGATVKAVTARAAMATIARRCARLARQPWPALWM